MVGVLALAIASLIGLSLGALAGFFGDERMKWKRGILLAFIPGLFFVWFFGFHVRRFELADAAGLSPYRFAWECLLSLLVSGAVLLVFWLMGKAISRIPFLSRSISIPVDSVISRLIEVLNSMPTILLIISFSVVFRKSIALLILIIGIFGWTQIARLTRAEMLRISNLDYMDAARAMGFGTFRLIFRHALPNGLGPVTVAIAFGIAGAIIIESALSFLGIGVPDDAVTWGKLLSIARSRYSAWWMAVFPGFAIFFTVSLFNLLGEKLRNHFEQLEPVQAQEPDKK
jgi:peptide/nickel transport system permease protein